MISLRVTIETVLMNRTNRNNINQSRRDGQNRPAGRARNVSHLSKMTNASVPFQVGHNRQLISVPSHSYQLKVRRFFRVYVGPGVAPNLLVTTDSVMAAVRAELGGLSATTDGEHFALFSARFYVTDGSVASGANVAPSLGVKLFDIEEGTTDVVCAQFLDNGSPASVAKVFVVYPVQNRPTWNGAVTDRAIARVEAAVADRITIDMEIEYLRFTATIPTFGVLDYY